MRSLKIFALVLSTLFLHTLQGQINFSDQILLDCGPVEDQQKTGTCWSFSSASFLESELMRMGMDYIDLSEMHIVRNIYLEKGMNYVLRQGNATFGQGSLAHDFLNAAEKYGVVPESEFSGRKRKDAPYDHSKLVKSLEKTVEEAVEKKQSPEIWWSDFKKTLDKEIGKEVDRFTYKGSIYTPEEFYRALPLQKKDYLHLTSFTHHPFYQSFILEIPDNFSNGSYYNLPLDELVEITDRALEKGFTLVWDGDVSEEGFDSKQGVATIEDSVNPSQLNRQNSFMNFQTTDDHLMHIVGKAKDDEGNEYYIIKNSWGEIGPYKGYMYMSLPYFKMKTVGITVHKDALPADIGATLKL